MGTLSLLAACLWAVLATSIALAPARFHWRAAWALIASGVPILGWVTYENGPVWGLAVLVGGMSVLRWPLVHLMRRLRQPDPAE
ncbi:DUF2484 family protein [Phaeovulum sp. NW3]|uniref:DUF2484 family protein n=1 Tax=Phaeovulum sp. NW3 TaxID=2934933 RepID=UPI0020222E69|nr:DUF2484 family protein [Phaeovulum sp. NW3]MCL7464400.1 DUF2484 family protein [Phaeovulum sp. NW3]